MKKLLALIFLTSPLSHAQETVSLFDGKTLDGWQAVDAAKIKYWSVIDGVITASNGKQKMPVNTYLATKKNYQNFEFTCKFRLSGDHATGLINSGIQYRSLMQKTPKRGVHKIIGYQADIGKGYWGDIYDEHRRGKLVKGNTKELLKDFKEDGWNDYKIVCQDNNHKLYINGHLTVNYDELDKNIANSGVIALQLHSGGIAKMEYKDISIKEYPATPLALPLGVAASEAKIHGKGLRLQAGSFIVAWNKTGDYLEWTVPAHVKSGGYSIVLNYSCDTNRQGSDMSFSNGVLGIDFKTIGKKKKWSASKHNIGKMNLKPGDKLLLKCNKIKADWVLDFHGIEFEPIK